LQSLRPVRRVAEFGPFDHMSTPAKQFTWADAWILLSIIFGSSKSGSATLRDVIEVGDGLNHAIFNYGELDDGLWRLIEAGHIVRDGDRFRVTETVATAYGKISRRARVHMRQMEELETFLGVTSSEVDYVPPIEGSARIVTREAFNAAVRGYVGRSR
jgi:hypothetical protein